MADERSDLMDSPQTGRGGPEEGVLGPVRQRLAHWWDRIRANRLAKPNKDYRGWGGMGSRTDASAPSNERIPSGRIAGDETP